MKKTAEERFWAKVDKTGECWLWTAARASGGYGQFWRGGKMVYSHRLAFEWTHGEIPRGTHVDHKCHTHNCVRPEHLRLATNAQNQQNRRGANSGSATGIRGVSWHKHARKYLARVRLSGKMYHAGYYDTIEEAEAAVIAKRRELFTHDDYAAWAASAEEA